MNKTIRYILYFVVLAICIMSVFIGVYNLELATAEQQKNIVTDDKEEKPIKIEETAKDKFKKLFTNEFFSSNYDDSAIQKLDSSKPIVYSESQTVAEDGKYKIDAYLPIININSEVAQKFNEDTIANFGNRANTLMNTQNVNTYTIYDTSFTSYINNNILSVAIMGSIKEGDNAQRIMIKSYNYNLDTGKEVIIDEVLNNKGIDSEIVNKKIKNDIKDATEHAETVARTGYDIFKRNINDASYELKNVNNFILGPNGILFIIFAYGNLNNTSEMDIIEIGYE